MKNLNFLAMMFAALCAFSACEPAGNGELTGELTLKANPKMILSNGEYPSQLEVFVGNTKVTSGVSFFDGESNELDLPDMKFTTTEEGTYTIWAAWGEKISNEVTITAVEEFPLATEIPADPNPASTSFVRNILLTQFTGTNCGYCPYMVNIIRELPASYTKRCILTVAHRYNESDNAFLQTALEQSVAFPGYPALVADLHSIESDYRTPGLFSAMVQAAINREKAKAGIAVCASYNDKTRMVSVKAEIKAAVTDNYRIGAWILEDGIYSKQYNPMGVSGYNYDLHDNCIRIVESKVTSTDYTGLYLGEIKAGEKKQYEFNAANMVLDPSWKAENCHVVVFITTKGDGSATGTLNEWYVNNVVGCPLNSAVAYQYK